MPPRKSIFGESKVRDLKKAFRRIDANGDGNISSDELRAVLINTDPVMWTESAVQKVLDEVDKNSNGKVDFDEFVDWAFACPEEQQAFVTMLGDIVPAGMDPMIAAPLVREFDMYDVDRNGFVTKPEIAAVVRIMDDYLQKAIAAEINEDASLKLCGDGAAIDVSCDQAHRWDLEAEYLQAEKDDPNSFINSDKEEWSLTEFLEFFNNRYVKSMLEKYTVEQVARTLEHDELASAVRKVVSTKRSSCSMM
eukprot:TRINITY_DN34616_c0_g1_i1.p1 TRINITY_DN34616_c0_g1~~TRINITY_DN34616_c0_g1_i1.p1  ORF type:complete len:259 (+),score=66.43 TRINITY_DN34616_c0_g1_i1:28-777(+)